uniref:Ribosomal protein S20 n=1 Tax=Lessonia spicata TaxID=1899210 RepID=A0A516ICM4_9PHAE|nr:30S ribosomal protein S20 [Lessonia spicata]YP_010990748.1 ribosomal protein S20 [Lessonia nigrescens]QDP13876.1 30S ribosomal protein S20 [Lessonia spicata]QWK42649.1 ribosomal protein S20 [Lessonia spicata]WOX59781.1 ribosomal protein S20 [Lessonia nigrescens]
MANNKSSKKRIKINKRNRIQNNSYKSLIKSYEKKHLNLIKASSEQSSNLEEDKSNYQNLLRASFSSVVSQIDKAVKKKIIHKNTAIRKKTNLFKKTFPTVN